MVSSARDRCKVAAGARVGRRLITTREPPTLRAGERVSEFHYVRTSGKDGGVDACEGPAIGLDLETVLKDGLPPWNVALEMAAALCEILDIADEDGEIHGDVHPKYVFIDETGAVSLEGF